MAKTQGCFSTRSFGLTWLAPSGSLPLGAERIACMGEASDAQISATQYSRIFFLLYCSRTRVIFTDRSLDAYCQIPFSGSSRIYSSPGFSPVRKPFASKCHSPAVSSAKDKPGRRISNARRKANKRFIIFKVLFVPLFVNGFRCQNDKWGAWKKGYIIMHSAFCILHFIRTLALPQPQSSPLALGAGSMLVLVDSFGSLLPSANDPLGHHSPRSPNAIMLPRLRSFFASMLP